MSQVFISRAKTNREFVKKYVHPAFEVLGISIWDFELDLEISTQWEQEIFKALEQSDWFVLVLSEQSVKSPFIKKELQWAMNNRPGRIFPIKIDNCDVGAFQKELREIHYLDFSESPTQARQQLVRQFARRLDREYELARDKRIQLSATAEDQREEIDDLHQQVEQLTAQIQSLAEFDGQWSAHQWGEQVPFCPRSERAATIIAVANVKGGVGKTTLTANLGAALAESASAPRVLLMDLDYQGDLTNLCLPPNEIRDLEEADRLSHRLFNEDQATPATLLNCLRRLSATQCYLVGTRDLLTYAETRAMARWLASSSRLDTRHLLRQILHDPAISQRFDYILLDCPPRMSTACVNALSVADFVLIPLLLDHTSGNSVPRMLKWLRAMKDHGVCPELDILGILANKKSDRRSDLIQRESHIWEKLPQRCHDAWQSPVHRFATVMPLSGAFADFANADRTSGAVKFASGSSELRGKFQELIAEVVQRVRVGSEVRT